MTSSRPARARAPGAAVARGDARAAASEPAGIAFLQASAGNRAVGMLLRQFPFELPLPWLLGGERPRQRPGADLRLDPERVAEAEASISACLATEALLGQIGRVRLGRPPPGTGEPGGPDVISGADPRAQQPAPPAATAPTPATPAPATQPVPPAGPPKPGEVGDLMDAVTAHPAVAAGIAKVKDEALRAFRAAPPGERRLAIVSVVTFSALALGGAASTPGGREMLGRLSGKVLPVPGVDWLGVEFNSQGENQLLGVHVDVGSLLPKSWGFGPAGPGQGPPTMTPGTGPGNF